MLDNSAQSTQINSVPSYTDAYQPPAMSSQPPVMSNQPPVMSNQPQAITTPAGETKKDDDQGKGANAKPDDTLLKQPIQSLSSQSEALEDQNIFHLLGVNDGSDQEKEKFLDELQQVVWEDFLENDVKLLLTKEEYQQLMDILQNKEKSEFEQQETAISFLEGIIPDLEEIMLEKALDLKEDLVKERIAGMKELYAGKTEQLEMINKADELIKRSQWYSAAQILNDVK